MRYHQNQVVAIKILTEERQVAPTGKGRVHGLSCGLFAHLAPGLTIAEQPEAAPQQITMLTTTENTLSGQLGRKVGQIKWIPLFFHFCQFTFAL